MIRFRATPFFMTQEFFRRDYMQSIGPTSELAPGRLIDYDERKTLEIDGIEGEEWRVLEFVWCTFQNIDEDRRCPDDGRSMMVGDLVRLGNFENDDVTWHRVGSFGFHDVSAPMEGDGDVGGLQQAIHAARGDL